jgi:membrane protein YqaA with SNARE-associated domain
VPALATIGSLAGAALTFWMGEKIGAEGLDRYIPHKRLDRIRRKVRNTGAIGFAVLDLIPPPFPYTPFILAAGGLEVGAGPFFATLTVCRVIRFGGEAVLAAIYGRHILKWFESELFDRIVIGWTVLGVALTVLSLVKLARAPQRTSRRHAA